MTQTIRTGAIMAALVLTAPMAAGAQGLMSGTGTQPSTQLATPPDAPAIDQPGAEQKALAQKARERAATHAHAAAAGPTTGSAATAPKP